MFVCVRDAPGLVALDLSILLLDLVVEFDHSLSQLQETGRLLTPPTFRSTSCFKHPTLQLQVCPEGTDWLRPAGPLLQAQQKGEQMLLREGT